MKYQAYTISIIVAIVIIGVENIIIKYANFIQTYFPSDWTALVLFSGTAGVIYRAIMYFYEKRGWKLLNRNIDISGCWKHKLIPINPTPNNDRSGDFIILQTAFEIKFCGKNYDCQTNEISQWRSIAVGDEKILERELWMIYEITRHKKQLVEGESTIDRGLINLQLEFDDNTGKIVKMVGRYGDAGTSCHQGRFEAERVF